MYDRNFFNQQIMKTVKVCLKETVESRFKL